MDLFVDADECEDDDNKAYYHAADIQNKKLNSDELASFFTKSGFVEFNVDESLLTEPLPYQLFIASPQSILNK